MMKKDFLKLLLAAFLAVAGLTACNNDDEPKDSVKEIKMQVFGRNGRYEILVR